ncbi:MAG: DUF4405 domain-containing protein [bacterium]|nr:DUF4405 domain-containing protein [bacterium]
MSTSRIHTRGLTSFFTLFGFIIMSITGLVLYMAPAGRVAYWTIWDFVGLSKTSWDSIHILSSLLFIVAGVIHTWLNWKPLMNYFRDKLRQGLNLRRELAISSIVTVWVVVSAIWPFPPLSYLLDFNAWIKTVWVVEAQYEPPFGHAEMLSLKVFCQKMDIDLTKATEELTANGIKFTAPEQTLEEIALANRVSPMDIYVFIKKFEPAPAPAELKTYTPESIELEFAGSGFGMKSVASMCERVGLDTLLAKQRIATAGLEVTLDQPMREAANANRTEALELMKVMLIDGYLPKITR